MPQHNFPSLFKVLLAAASLTVAVAVLPAAGRSADPAPAGDTGDTIHSFVPMEWYFRLQPARRVEILDSLITNRGDVIVADFIEDDMQALLGDTTSVMRFCSFSGSSMKITHFEKKKTDKIISGWKKKLAKNELDKRTVVNPLPAIEYDSIFPDSMSTFLFFYIKLPLATRMEYFSDNAMSQRTDLTQVIVLDLNSVMGCSGKPFINYNGRPATDMAELLRCEVCWRDWLEGK